MTMDDLKCQNRSFYGFFGDFGLWHTFQERIAPKSVEIDMDKLHTKFSAWNVDFNSPSLDFLGSRKPAQKGIKERYPRKSRFFTVVGQSFVKTVADRHGHAAYDNKHRWQAFQSYQHQCLRKIQRMNCDKMAGDKLTVCEQELLSAFVRLVSISSNLLLDLSTSMT